MREVYCGSIGNRTINVLGCMHLELVHSLPGLRNVQLVGILACHSKSLLFRFFRGFVRRDRLCGKVSIIRGFLRKRWGMVEKEQVSMTLFYFIRDVYQQMQKTAELLFLNNIRSKCFEVFYFRYSWSNRSTYVPCVQVLQSNRSIGSFRL